jgi:hypothetical protein
MLPGRKCGRTFIQQPHIALDPGLLVSRVLEDVYANLLDRHDFFRILQCVEEMFLTIILLATCISFGGFYPFIIRYTSSRMCGDEAIFQVFIAALCNDDIEFSLQPLRIAARDDRRGPAN